MKSLSLYIVTIVLVAEFITAAGVASAEPVSFDKDLSQLEKDVWTASETQLLDLEARVVRYIQRDAEDPIPFYLLAHLRLREFTNSPEDLVLIRQAAELAQQAVELSPDQDLGYVALAETLDLMSQSSKGIQLLESASAFGVQPTWRIYFTLARLYAESGSKEKILGLLEQALSFKDSDHDIVVPYVVAVIQTTDQGADLLAKLHDWNRRFPNVLFQQTIAITLADLGRYKDARMVYEAIYHQQPTYVEAMINNAIILYRNLEKPAEAKLLFRKVATLISPDKHDPMLINMMHSHLAATLIKLGEFPAAEKEFILAAKGSHDRLSMLDFIAKSYRNAKQAKHLASLVKKLTVEIEPSGLIYALLGETQSEDLKEHQAALESFANAILLDPGRSDFYNGMGLTYYRMQRREDALRYFVEATKVDPNDATSRYNEACVLSLLGRSRQALGSLQEALSLDPALLDTARNDGDFANIKSLPEFKQLLNAPKDLKNVPEERLSH